ncbi:MAG TPA: hypothetical protein VEA99_04315 [Gemmatimonadaceae bacterium]|nr:hypothetical protein [Gemmatimonadaceae bacterium]
MNEIVQMVAQRTGIPTDKAQMAVSIVLEQLKGRLPGPIAQQVESALGGGGAGGGGLGGLGGAAGALGGMLGKK